MSDNLDVEVMREIYRGLLITNVRSALGEAGVMALDELLTAIRRLFQHLHPEDVNGSLIVFRHAGANDAVGSMGAALGASAVSEQRVERLPKSIPEGNNILIEVRDGVGWQVWSNVPWDLTALAVHGVVYQYRATQPEQFFAGTLAHTVASPAAWHASVFATPTFRSLDEALRDYDSRVVRYSSCFILQKAWADSQRLFFVAGPEELLRQSLHQFLSIKLRDAEVRPEQNVDESHPVDLRVRWQLTTREALIEIKWLGKSLKPNGRHVAYYDQRARDGAKQLADYLEKNHSFGPTNVTRGYLVVIDARRYGLSVKSTSVTPKDGSYYRDKEIDYSPAYHKIRSDFASPHRMFVEPVVGV